MDIYLLDRNKDMVNAWNKIFADLIEHDTANIYIVHDTLKNFIQNHPLVDGIVSPANSFGIMDGGYDKAIIDIFGSGLQARVKDTLKLQVGGYQTPGTCIPIPFNEKMVLFHTPTMRYPEEIEDGRIVFDCMYNTLKMAKRYQRKAIVIPAFGGCTGALDFDVIARYMRLGYEYALFNNIKSTWGDVNCMRLGFYYAEGKI